MPGPIYGTPHTAHHPSPYAGGGHVPIGEDPSGEHLLQLTPVEALARHRELYGYDLLHTLEALVRRVLTTFPPSNCKVVLQQRAAAASDPPLDNPPVNAPDGSAHCHPETLRSSPALVDSVIGSPAAQSFLCEFGFVLYDVDGEQSMLIPSIPADGTRAREQFVREWTLALSCLRWAGSCNTSLLHVRCGRLVLLQPLSGSYRVRVTLQWRDEIDRKHEQELSSPYRDADRSVVAITASARGNLGGSRDATGRLDSSGSSDADDSYTGSEDGLQATSYGSLEGSPERSAAGGTACAATDPVDGTASGSTSDGDRGLNGADAAEVPLDRNAVDAIADAMSTFLNNVRKRTSSPPQRTEQPNGTSSSPTGLFRYGDTWDAFPTRCDSACDITVEVLKRRPLIMDRVEAVGMMHYRNFGLHRVELDLRDPDRPASLPVGRVAVVVSSLNHRCFEIEQRRRETRSQPMRLSGLHHRVAREQRHRRLRRLNSEEAELLALRSSQESIRSSAAAAAADSTTTERQTPNTAIYPPPTEGTQVITMRTPRSGDDDDACRYDEDDYFS